MSPFNQFNLFKRIGPNNFQVTTQLTTKLIVKLTSESLIK